MISRDNPTDQTHASAALAQAIAQPPTGSKYGPILMKDPYLFLAALDQKVYSPQREETALDRDSAYETAFFVSDSTAQLRIPGWH